MRYIGDDSSDEERSFSHVSMKYCSLRGFKFSRSRSSLRVFTGETLRNGRRREEWLASCWSRSTASSLGKRCSAGERDEWSWCGPGWIYSIRVKWESG